jgi:flagellar assembly factor FliW
VADGKVALPVLPVRASDRIPSEEEPPRESETKDLDVLLVLSVPPGEPWKTTVHLSTPILVNPRNRKAFQVVMADRGRVAEYLFDEEQRKAIDAYLGIV